MRAVTEEILALAARLHRRERGAMHELADRFSKDTTPGRLEGLAWAFRDWFSHGLPLTVFRTIDDAVALAETDPPSWDTPFPTGGGQWALEIGDCFVLYKSAWNVQPNAETPSELLPHWSDIRAKSISIVGPCPFDGDQLNRITNNVLVALTERPEGLEIVERRPSAKAARKRGRRYFPGVEYVIASTTPLWRPEHARTATNSRAPADEPQEGWTLSVRTMVRGHWRQQACGPQMSERKVTWVRPHWKGPEDAPLSVHATSISSALKGSRPPKKST